MKIRKDDMVQIIAGADKGKSGKVLHVHPKTQMVTIEGIGLGKRYVKPNQLNPQGGMREIHRPIDVSKVMLLVGGKDLAGRVGYQVKKDGSKVRVARKLGNKEIK